MSTATLKTTCPLDCPDACTLEVTIEDGRAVKVRGDDSSFTRGIICGKVADFPRQVYDDEYRLHTPLRRSGPKGSGSFEPIGWDQALQEITQRFVAIRDEWGGEAILPYHYGGSNGLLTDSLTDRAYFARLGASRLDKTICAVPTTLVSTGMYGRMPGVSYEDYPLAKCIVVWGQNPKACSIHLVPFLKQAKANGAQIIVVDPRNNFSDREIDLHVPVAVGGDLPLALGMIRWIRDHGHIDEAFIDEHCTHADRLLAAADEWTLDRAAAASGVDAHIIESFARTYAESDPAVIRCGWGLERNRNGGQAVGAVFALPALTGKFGVPGGGFTMSNSGAVLADVDGAMGGIDWDTRLINMTQLADALLEVTDPPVKGMFVYNCNPVATVPDQEKLERGMKRDDLFTVVFDQVMTDSAAFADIVLPATTFFEHHDVRRAYGNYVVGGVRPVIDPVGQSRSNPSVFRALGNALGWHDGPFGWDDETAVQKVAARTKAGDHRVDGDTMLEGGTARIAFDGGNPIQFKNVFPRTPDEKVNLCPEVLGDKPYRFEAPENDFPLALITPASSRLVTSTFGQYNLKTLKLTIHPDDAQTRGVSDGDPLRVFNNLGSVECIARVRPSIRPGVVMMPKGAWKKSSLNGATSTALCPSHVNVVGGAACFNDARVEVEVLNK